MILFIILISTSGFLQVQALMSMFKQSYIFSYEVEAYKSMAHIFTYFLMLFMPVHLLYYFNVKLYKVRNLTRLITLLIFIQVLSGFLYPVTPWGTFIVKSLSGISFVILITYLHYLVLKNLPQMLAQD